MSDPWLALADFKARTIMPSSDVDALARHRYEKRSADASALAPTPETRFAEIVVTTTLAFVLLTASVAVASNATDFAVITIAKRTAGGGPTTLATLSTETTALPAGVPVAIPISVADVTAEDILTVTIAKAGAGVVLPPLFVDVRPTNNFVTQSLEQNQAHIESRLRKRYDIPFSSPFPEAACRWLTKITTLTCYEKRGFNPGSEQDREGIIGAAATAETQITEAADAKEGLFELPLREEEPDVSGVTKGFPLGYSEQSPYVGFDRQLAAASNEDGTRTGSGGA
jgi:hypothetical protein